MIRRARLVASTLAAVCATAHGSPLPPAPAVRPVAASPSPDAYGYYAPPGFRFTLRTSVGGRYNPLGLELAARAGMQGRMFASDAKVLRNNYIFFGVVPGISPTQVHVGPSIEIAPLSIFSVRMTAEVHSFFGNLGFAQSFASPLSDYSDSAQDMREGRAFSSTGVHLPFQPVVQLPFLRAATVHPRACKPFLRLILEIGSDGTATLFFYKVGPEPALWENPESFCPLISISSFNHGRLQNLVSLFFFWVPLFLLLPQSKVLWFPPLYNFSLW